MSITRTAPELKRALGPMTRRAYNLIEAACGQKPRPGRSPGGGTSGETNTG